MGYGYITMKSGEGSLKKRTLLFGIRPIFADRNFRDLWKIFGENGRNFLDSCIGHSAGRILAVAVEKI